ncbi:MAG: DUF4870 domain-containing protein [Spirochaetales bacterium]|nr:DUF4870 domain-containing protein [Spirochaetales bacterium]
MEKINIGSDGKVILPQPDEISKREKEDAMGAYLMMFAAWGIGLPLPFFSFIAALIYHLINRKKSRFVAFHSYQSLLSETVVSALNTILIIWLLAIAFSSHHHFATPFFIYLLFTVFWNIVYVIASLVGCVKAKNGQFLYFLVFGQIAFRAYYGESAIIRDRMQAEKKPVNLPPEKF